MPFGVELPENLGEEKAQESPVTEETKEPDTSKDSTESDKSPETAKELLELDKLERFRFDGKEWSPKDFKNSYLMHGDYTRKTQELSKERQYVDNFSYDLARVIKDPKLMDEFRKVYPKQYVQRAEEALSTMGHRDETPSPETRLDPKLKAEIDELKGTVSEWKESQAKAEIEQIQSWLTNQYESLSKKYPYANQDAVTMRANYLSDQGTEITKETLEKIFKSNDSEIKAVMDKMYKEKVTKQIEVGNKAKDIGAGGGTPTPPPLKMKLTDVKNKILEDIEAKN